VTEKLTKLQRKVLKSILATSKITRDIQLRGKYPKFPRKIKKIEIWKPL
jgi:hypothetical protein